MLYSNITPEKNYWIGADGFTWWIGQVQADGGRKLNKDGSSSPYKDETASNRVKVRIIGYHTSKHDELPVEDLPWAQVMMPTTTPQSSGYAMNHQLSLGSWVIGFFMDGMNCQQPIVMGVIGNIDTGQKTKFTPGQILTDNPEEPGFNNILHPLFNPKNSPGGDSSVPSSINSTVPTTFGTGFTYKYIPGGKSPLDKKQEEDKKVSISVANGKCSKETQQKIDETLGDLFRFLKTIKKVNNKYINVYTGEIINFVSIISGFVGRLVNIVSEILASVKTLIVDFIRKTVRDLINSILAPNAFCLDVAKELGDQLLNSILCLIDNLVQTLFSFIENIIVSLVENVVNAAFCLVQGVINSLMSAITSAISGTLQTVSSVVSLIASGGDLISNLASKVSDFIASLCTGFGCNVDVDRYDTNIGEFLPKNLFGSFGAGQTEAFINTDFLNINSPKIFDSEGKLVSGTLNCSPDNLALLACPPSIVLTGLQKTAVPPKLKAVIDSAGKLISAVITNPGSNINLDASVLITSCNGFGNGAKAKPIITNGKLTNLIIENPGNGYPDFDKTADNKDESLVISSNSKNYVGNLDNLEIINVGENYDENTKILIDGEECGIPEIINGEIVSISNICKGKVIDKYPEITILGNGSGAKIVPVILFKLREQQNNIIYPYNKEVEIIDCPGHPNGN